MSSPPTPLGPFSVPATANLFNLAAANQPRWDRFLFSCCPQEQPRDRFCHCPQDLTDSGGATAALPRPCQVSITRSRGDIWGGGDIWGMLVASGLRCVCISWLFGLTVDAFSANFRSGTFASLLCCHHSGIQPRGSVLRGISFICLILFSLPSHSQIPSPWGTLIALCTPPFSWGGDDGCKLWDSTWNQSPQGACCCLPLPKSGFRTGFALI